MHYSKTNKIHYLLFFSILIICLSFFGKTEAQDSIQQDFIQQDCAGKEESCVVNFPSNIFGNKAGENLPVYKGGKDGGNPDDPNTPPPVINEAATSIIKIVFSLGGILAVITMTVAGILMVLGIADNEELVGKAKKMIIYAIIGLVIMAGAYAIILGISNINLSSSF